MEFKIGVLAGDGIGPEIVEQAVKVMDAVAEKFSISAPSTIVRPLAISLP